MKKRIRIKTVTLFLFVFSTCLFAGNFFIEPISPEKLRMFPIPTDYRNYFFLQSIDDETSIIIGDFTGAEKIVSHIIDEGSDNTIDKIYDYYPDNGKTKVLRKSNSIFFKNDIAELKMDIIDGKIFRENYSYKMKSLETLNFKLDQGTDIFPYGDGYSIKFFDPDAPTTIMSEFFFSKRFERYDLIFKTNYYKLFNSNIQPPIEFSVYCKNSKDPVVAKVVEELLVKVKSVK
ncbi:MAG TPA: hypothetical protein PK926_15315 [Spirochaetota bacterium]|nr:hypothetical protein [Spirochaetota bacterium]HPI91022.1 hypothetical protein [Spirochaetota bacterium]HPR48598.1 hypothetical protein [Spirochaetota bacterium]